MPVAVVVQIAQEADWQGLIENRRFEGALILGPAVLAPLDNVSFSNCVFDAPPEALFVEVNEGRPAVGMVVLRNLVFEKCRFQNVALAGTRETLRPLQSTINQTTQPVSPEEGAGGIPSAESVSTPSVASPGASSS